MALMTPHPTIRRQVRSLVAWLALAWISLLISPPAARAEVILQADFDQASLNIARSRVDGDVVTLVGRDNYNSGHWKWIYFAAKGVAGRQLTFRIDGDYVFGSGTLAEHRMTYSFDRKNWKFFDINQLSADGMFTFFNETPFREDAAYIAYGLPYPYQRVVEHAERIAASPWVHPTPSGAGSLIIGRSPGGIDDMDRTIRPRNIYGYRISDDQPAEHRDNHAVARKTKVVLVSGVHANESLASYVLEGLVDFLISDAPEAQALRRRAEFFVYPMVNPDGRRAGYNRSTVQYSTRRPNRHWKPPAYGGLDDIRLVGEAMRADVVSADVVIDFHSDSVGKSGHYAYVLPEWQDHPLWTNFLQLEPQVQTRNARLRDRTMARFGRDELGAKFSITFETQFIAGEQSHRFFEMGANWARALQATLAAPSNLSIGAADSPREKVSATPPK
jgi:hypothetical protein